MAMKVTAKYLTPVRPFPKQRIQILQPHKHTTRARKRGLHQFMHDLIYPASPQL